MKADFFWSRLVSWGLHLLMIGLLGVKIVGLARMVDWSSPDYNRVENLFLHSQYNLNQGYEFWGNITDDWLYAYTAYKYGQGVNPGNLNFESPPLGKYLFFISHQLTGSMMLVQIVSFWGLLLVTYKLGRQVGLKKLTAVAAVLLVGYDPLINRHLSFLNLDFLNYSLVLTSLWLLLTHLRVQKKISLIALGVVLGAALATRAFVEGAVLLGYIGLVMGISKEKSSSVIGVMGMALGVYLFSYFRTLMEVGVVGLGWLHIKIIRFYLSYLPEYPWGEIWRILILGRWRTWFASPLIQPIKEFWYMWPTMMLLSGVTVGAGIKDKKRLSGAVMILAGWIGVDLIYHSTHVVFPKLVILILPLIYVLGIKGITTTLGWLGERWFK